MPALYWCGRKWRTSTDDFTFSGVFFFAILFVNGTLALSRYEIRRGASIVDCPEASFELQWSFLALGIIDIISASIFLMIAWLSLRGSPFQVSKRHWVPRLLSMATVFMLAMLAFSGIVIRYALYDDESQHCNSPTGVFLRVVAVFNIFVPCCYILMIALTFDPDGRQEWSNSGDYESFWYQRCHNACYCCFLCEVHNKDAFQDVSKTFAGLFCAYDLVPSDVVAGLLLVHGRQKHELRIRGLTLRYAPANDGRSERISLQARRFVSLTHRQREVVEEIEMYSRFYMAAYGWPLFEYMHCCTGLLRLCCFDPFMCCRHRPDSPRSINFCDMAAFRKVAQLEDDNVLLARWENTFFHPVFYVAVDESTNSIVVAIRGTMSFADCITDMVASPSVIQMPDVERDANTAAADYYVHGGMERSAAYVLSELRVSGILDRIIAGDLRNYNLVILGHSLGAGVASILSIIIWSTEQTLRNRMRCIAYAPPGGLMSPSLVAYSKRFIIGCFCGNDIVPRLSTHTVNALREAILDELMATSMPKSLLFMNLRCLDQVLKQSKPLAPRHRNSECYVLRNAFRNSPCAQSEETRRLYPPATLVHFCKAVVREPPACCCKEEVIYVPAFESPQDVQQVVCSPSMLRDHFPDRFFTVIAETNKRLKEGELDRFFIATAEKEEEREGNREGREGGGGEHCDYGTTLGFDMIDIV